MLFGGLPVIFSYYILSLENDAKQLWAGLTGWVYQAWLVSMILTVISYLYLGYMFVWGIQDAYVFEWTGAEVEPWLCSLYTLFLGSAAQYAFIALRDLKNKEKSVYLSINLWLTGFISLLIGASAVAINGVSDLHNILSIITGFIIALHHVFFDAIYWLQTFEPKYSELV
jgi:hypothetical protein